MKETEKYVGYYLLVYVVVLFICGFFQYMAICQGKTLECAFSMTGINTIITTTAYVLTPIIAIIGFLSWKSQYNLKIHSDSAKEILALFEKASYELLILDNFYNISQFKLKKIIESSDNPNDQVEQAKKVYQELESSMNESLLKVESQLNWILFRVTTLSIIIKSHDLLTITLETKEKVSDLLKPIRDQTNKTLSSKEFDAFYKQIAITSQITAKQFIGKVILVLKKYIEA